MMHRIRKFISKTISSIVGRNLNFVQMRLLVKDITPEFEESIKQRIEHNILRAKIREANEKDVECLKELHDRAWHSTPMPFRPLKEDSILEMLKDPKIVFLMAEVEGKDSGFALIYFTGDNPLIGVIAGLGIVPELHRKGLGTILAMAAWNYFKKKGVEELRCKVYIDNKISYNFIKSLKFEEYTEDFAQWKVF